MYLWSYKYSPNNVESRQKESTGDKEYVRWTKGHMATYQEERILEKIASITKKTDL